jgi:hypothetical protein
MERIFESETKLIVIVGLILIIGVSIGFYSNNIFVQLELNEVKDNVSLLKSDLESSNNQIIELTETNEYLVSLKNKAIKNENSLQLTYNKLWGDATSCYWASECLAYPSFCEDHFDWGAELGYVAQDYANYYFDECNKMDKDWIEYKEAEQ